MKRPDQRISRRALLTAGTLGLFGGALRAREAQAGSGAALGRAKRCILVYLLGGPPHLDMWDMKPGAPAEIRGPFRPIETAVPGIHVCEHMPQLAARTDRLSILRSLSFANSDHPYMCYYTLTGRVSQVPLGANTVLPPSRADEPHMGSVIHRVKHRDPDVPGYVAIPELRVRMGPMPVAGGGRSGFLGPRYEPLALNEDVREPMPLLTPPDDVAARLDGRDRLLAILDGRTPRSLQTAGYQSTRRRAMTLSRSASNGGLLDLDAENAALRDVYGRHRFGQSLLLARRLVERGTSFVAVHFNYMTKCDGWDTHSNNFDACKDELLPLLDQGLSALLDDLADRGMLDDTLVVTMGEFGRTPKINANAGRDHWGPCGSVVFAGGGIPGGRVVGASDKIGSEPTDLAVAPPDVVATIYHTLGIDPHGTMPDQFGRPIPLSDGRVIAELLA